MCLVGMKHGRISTDRHGRPIDDNLGVGFLQAPPPYIEAPLFTAQIRLGGRYRRGERAGAGAASAPPREGGAVPREPHN
ncbi:hypothetical protein EVAR_11155_1 [Eumeta japonica]|uniref:Uncharacterized protein n=1 Tax=Eumeta variegata TaxID=151549 RepID=A0A4C1U568_EUMVA|nr:hypothetical protein EVAR_11155_1 [Eumeta japonica]